MATVGTFDMCPGFEISEVSERRAVSTPNQSPVVRAREINERPVRIWELRWEKNTSQAIVRIRQLWALTCGPVLNLTWTPPNASAMEVRFADPELPYVRESANATSITLRLEEVL